MLATASASCMSCPAQISFGDQFISVLPTKPVLMFRQLLNNRVNSWSGRNAGVSRAGTFVPLGTSQGVYMSMILHMMCTASKSKAASASQVLGWEKMHKNDLHTCRL